MRKLLLILEIITGLTITSITKVHGDAALCNVSVVDNRLQANCSKTDIVDVPQNLDEKIQVLDLSYNQITHINAASFTRYNDLAVLIMRKMRLTASAYPNHAVDYASFEHMEKLEHLDLTESFFTITAQPKWPPYLRILNINYNFKTRSHVGHLILEKLEYLEEFYANDNGLMSFPDFSPLAPMKIIELENNPIVVIQILYIASFCGLQRLALKFPDGLYFHNEYLFCECIRINLWITVNNIEVTNPLNCTVPKNPKSLNNKCESTFSEQELELFRGCQLRILQKKYHTSFLLTTIFGTVGGLLILILCATIVYARRKARLESLRAEAAAAAAEGIDEAEEEEIPELYY